MDTDTKTFDFIEGFNGGWHEGRQQGVREAFEWIVSKNAMVNVSVLEDLFYKETKNADRTTPA